MLKRYALDLARVTERAAISAAGFIGKGDKNQADQAGVDAMRKALGQVEIRGRVVIGEGEIDEAPMLYIGEELGVGGENSPEVDIAVDPVEGTNLVAKGDFGSIAVMAFAPKGCFLHAPDMYMDKIACGKEGVGVVSLENTIEENIQKLAEKKGVEPSEILVAVLERDRHKEMIDRIRKTGARVYLYQDGDVATAIATCMEGSRLDLIMGIGGAPEGVLAAAAIKSLGGVFEGRLAPRNDEEISRAKEMGVGDIEKIFTADELVKGDDCIFSATGITDGSFVSGVKETEDYYQTNTVVISSEEGIRKILAQTPKKSLGDL